MSDGRVLVTGATGYIGNRLVPRLLAEGHRVRAMSRRPSRLDGRRWSDHPHLERAEADALDQASVRRACEGCDVVYYLIHSMAQGSGDFEEADRRAAENVAAAARDAGVDRIVYLGGLADPDPEHPLSRHRRSRLQVSRVLHAGEVPVTELRAAMIVGSGSAAFELTRYAVETLPVMLTHRWIDVPTQPIAVTDVLGYLIGCLERPEMTGETYDIGGPEILSGRELMEAYARAAGLRRRRIVSSRFVSVEQTIRSTAAITPLPRDLVAALLEGARNPAVCHDHRIGRILPRMLLPVGTAIERSLEVAEPREARLEGDGTEPPPAEWVQPGDPEWAGGTLHADRRQRRIEADRDRVWERLVGLASSNGLLLSPWLRFGAERIDGVTGVLDLPERRKLEPPVEEGDRLDFWVVRHADAPGRLVLEADVRVPGRARLEYGLEADGGATRLLQRATFRPRGLRGRMYWTALSGVHEVAFGRMLRNVARLAAG